MVRRNQSEALIPAPHPGEGRFPRTAEGEFGAHQDGECFDWSQGEGFVLEGEGEHHAASMSIVPLEDGSWLAGRNLLLARRHPDRAAALRDEAERVANIVTIYVIGCQAGDNWLDAPGSLQMDRGAGEAVIAWACGVAGIPPIPIPERPHPPKRLGLPQTDLFA